VTEVRTLEAGSAGYPPLLASLSGAPERLYVRGALSGISALAIVGSRKPTLYGRRMARKLASECARAGIVVVSGLARGIDTEAHRAALEAGGRTWAVLGSGLDRVYPKENERLAWTIVSEGGAVLSELAMDAGPLRGNFPARNRIISGLSQGVAVVEGTLRSGSLITARLAAEQGRDVFAVPGPADSPLSEGPNDLIRQGARMVSGLGDILEELPSLASGMRSAGPAPGGPGQRCFTLDGEKILELLGSHPVCLEILASETGWDFSRLLRALSYMEGEGVIQRLPGQQYARI